MSQFQDAFTKAKIAVMYRSDLVFFSTVMLSLKFIETRDIPTAATNGMYLKINPDFFMGLSPEERVFLLMHETYHVVFMHMTRLGQRDPQLWNVATDYAINAELRDLGLAMPEDGLYDAKYAGMTADDIYDLLQEEKSGAECPWPDLDSPQEGESGNDDQDEDTPDSPNNQPSAQEIEEYIQDVMLQAEVKANMGQEAGYIPAHIQRYLDSLKNPVLNWRILLRRYLFAKAKTRRTYQKVNRRFPDILMPTRYGEQMGRIAVVIDVSGSVSREQFHAFISETYSILKVMKPKQIDLIQFSHEITGIDTVRTEDDFKRVKFRGGGGTTINEVYDWVRENKPALTVCFTDGYFHDPGRPTKAPWLWMINSNPNLTMEWGRTLHFDPE